MYLTREATAYLSRRSRATSRPKRPQGDLRTTDCQESIIGLIIAVASSATRTGLLLSAQWSTFFTFLAALMILVNVDAANSAEQTFFGVLLIVIQFMPIAIGVGVGALNNLKDKKAKGKRRSNDGWYKDHQEDEEDERKEQVEKACAGDESPTSPRDQVLNMAA